MPFDRPPRNGGDCALSTVLSGVFGAVCGVLYAVATAEGSSFVVWAATGAGVVGSVVGAAAFAGGAVAYRALDRGRQPAAPRIGAVCAAALTAGAVLLAVLTAVHHVSPAQVAAGAAVVVGLVAALAVVPLERRMLVGRD